ncbi:DUF523 domain-containing protein [Desulfolucanica intricata]|uniref:DUF523 domain-containing protein n=1 Tax=Desulfolucanica intricata TaxID=1285191 RepID=UPI00082B9026|nr:DUF523 domain-containing protein [Desulfolucanica intricata]
MRRIIVSACLADIKCKYDGTYNTVPEIKKMVDEGLAIPVCPEVLGGGPIPREPNEIIEGDGFGVLNGNAKVVTINGADKTDLFLAGAKKVLDIAKKNDVQLAILKERSPSCGSSFIYDGSFSSKKIPGQGVTAALLKKEGLTVCSEENYKNFLK